MNNIIDDINQKILNNIYIKTSIKYIQSNTNDGEQMNSIFYKNKYPFNIVCKKWYIFFKKKI
tara:strand:- start:189 stop:374 length:186 start_codon:yes stop_codon:yes gene_type:complete